MGRDTYRDWESPSRLMPGQPGLHLALGRGLVICLAMCLVLPGGVVRAEVPPSIQAAIQQAAAWVSNPASEARIDAFTPAADIRHRVYGQPKPLNVWVVRIDLSHPGVRLAVTQPAASSKDEKAETRCSNTLQFARQRGVQLAINASAFDPFQAKMGLPMDVVGLAAVRGMVYSEADPRFGAWYVSREGVVTLEGPPLRNDTLWQVIPGFGMLVDDGAVAVTAVQDATKFGGPNPRTAVGVDRAGHTLWIVVVDGRQPGVSEGMTLVELAALFVSLGAWDALNLDGGGSSTLVLENQDHTYGVVNAPVGRGKAGTLRQVANNLGVYLPGRGSPRADERPKSLRDQVVAQAGARRGGGYKWAGDGVSKDIMYDGSVFLRAGQKGTYCCGATLETFLDAYCLVRYGHDASARQGRWFEGWPTPKLKALQDGWWGTEEATGNAYIPTHARPTIREKQLYHVLPMTGLAEQVADYRLLQRGDFVQFWRTKGSGHSVIFWGRDFDDVGRERMWYWSSQKRPRYAYPRRAGSKAVKTPGYGINWEYVGEEIDPDRIYGVRLLNDTDR